MCLKSGVRGCLVYTACLVCVFAVKSSYLGTSPYGHGCKAASWLVGLRNFELRTESQVNVYILLNNDPVVVLRLYQDHYVQEL